MCGIIGIMGPEKASQEAYAGLLTLQHRGQDAAGILSYDRREFQFHLHKKKGLVTEVFDEGALKDLKGSCAIGHTRYSTVGRGHVNELQPLHTSYPFGLGMAHNGNVVNYFELVEKLRRNHQFHRLTNNDLEVIQAILGLSLAQQLGVSGAQFPYRTYEDSFRPEYLTKAVEAVFQQVHGGYSVVGILAGQGLFAFRDPKGIRPLVIGMKADPSGSRDESEEAKGSGKNWYCLASETGTLNFLGYQYLRSLEAGELVFINWEGEIRFEKIRHEPPRPCMFEWVYFAGAESSLEDQSVHGVRTKLGKFLAKKIKATPEIAQSPLAPFDIVAPVPDTSRVAALSLARELGIDYNEVFIKNRYIQRSFILQSQEDREKAVELKFIPVKSEIEGKNILLVDDSIVRGTTSKRIVGMLRRYGARGVTLVSTCPAIAHPCFYGIDFPDKDELLAQKYNLEEMAKVIGADRVVYLNLEDLTAAINLSGKNGPCMACLTGEYPVDVSASSNFHNERKKQRSQARET